jgi:rod shape-determining protein MreC
MAPTNFSINKKKRLWPKILVAGAALFILLLILNFFSPVVKNTFFILSSPIQKIFWSAGQNSSGFLGSLLNAGAFSKENEKLKSENEKLLVEIASLQSIINANKAQSNVSLACQDSKFNLLMAVPVGVSKDDILTINKGLADGISENMPVISQQKALVGRVIKTYKNYSEVMLISNKSSVVNVKVLQQPAASAEGSGEPKEVNGVIKGRGNSDIFLDLVPIDDQLNVNDVLVTSALEGSFPKDLLVGKINKIDKNDQNPHQQAQVHAFFYISTDNIFVITNYKQK